MPAASQALADDYDDITDDPYGAAWMVAIKPSDLAELDGLLDAAAYQKHCDEEG